MVQCSPHLDSSFSALADPTRRGILQRLGHSRLGITDLAVEFDMSLTGMKKHVQVLEDAGLVATEKIGRTRFCTLGARKLDEESRWIANYQQMLVERLDSLEHFLEHTKEQS